MSDYDVIVIGGGMIGAAIGYGLSRLGQKTALFDEGDIAFRAARGNFGLVWVQGKGLDCPQYADWTRRSADKWGGFICELEELTGIDSGYSRPGGVHLCLDDEELDKRRLQMASMEADSNGEFQSQMLDRKALAELMPGIGPTVTGGSYSPQDGHVNPLYLLRALHAAFRAKNGLAHHEPVIDLSCKGGVFKVTTAQNTYTAAKIVLAAGLGNKQLASKVGLNVPVHPQRGQILVTEKLQPMMNYPTIYSRQTVEGSILLGDSHEDVGLDDGTSVNIMHAIARRAIRLFPHLKQARIVRTWGALRILTPDGLPVYDQSPTCPGAFSASSHSGVTLASVHAMDFAKYVVAGELPKSLETLSERRFHVH